MVKYRIGDRVVYQKSKRSTHPGARAEDVRPSAHGEEYAYRVDKYWRVTALLEDDKLEISTRTGKRHRISARDRSLRKANLIELITRKNRFPSENPAPTE